MLYVLLDGHIKTKITEHMKKVIQEFFKEKSWTPPENFSHEEIYTYFHKDFKKMYDKDYHEWSTPLFELLDEESDYFVEPFEFELKDHLYTWAKNFYYKPLSEKQYEFYWKMCNECKQQPKDIKINGELQVELEWLQPLSKELRSVKPASGQWIATCRRQYKEITGIELEKRSYTYGELQKLMDEAELTSRREFVKKD